MKEECGITENSLENARELIDRLGVPNKVTLNYIKDPWDYIVKAEWDTFTFEFSGFSWGYGGTAPHGLDLFITWCVGNNGADKEIFNLHKEVENYVIFEKF